MNRRKQATDMDEKLEKVDDAPVVIQPSEESDVEARNSSTSSSEVVKITLEEYQRSAKVSLGLLASFKVEAKAKPQSLEPKTTEEWAKAFQLQSERVYK